jgi:hypothetical protein
LQIATDEPAPIVGSAFTVTTLVAVALQPEVVPVTEYVVVEVGLAVTLAPDVAESPVDGVQVYVVPPVAVNAVDDPLQIATPEPAAILGSALTVAVTAVLDEVTHDPLVALK